MRTSPFIPESPSLTVRPWPDPVIDALGHDPRSPYVERYWLGILGPSTTWLLRRLAAGFDRQPDGFELDLGETAGALGLSGHGGRHSPFVRTLARVVQFDLGQPAAGSVLHVRRKLPPLNRRQLGRLPESLQADHERWQAQELHVPEVERQRRRARRLALSLLELGEETQEVEAQLLRWRYHPSLCRESVLWAAERQAEARAASEA